MSTPTGASAQGPSTSTGDGNRPDAVGCTGAEGAGETTHLALLALLDAHRAAVGTLTAIDELIDVLVDRTGPPPEQEPRSDGVALTSVLVELRMLDTLHDLALAARARALPSSLVDFLR